jgi:hypothetical protein
VGGSTGSGRPWGASGPQQPQVALTPFTLSYAAFRTFYEPEWPKLAGVLKQLDESKPPVVVPPPTPTGLRSNSFAVFCQDWSLPVNSYQQYAARQLGREGVLLTYEGWGHGSYNSSPCMQTAIDTYLISRVVPKRSTNCPAVPPA